MGKFHQFLTEVSAHPTFVFLFFVDDCLGKYQSIFTKLSLILWRSGLLLLMGQFCQFLTAHHTSVFYCNSVDPDQILCSPASNLGLHCLPITLLRVSRLKWIK